MPVTEHFLLQLREFYVEAVVTAKFAGKGMEKEWEEFFFCFFGKIDALSMCVRVRIYKRWKPCAVGVEHGKHLTCSSSVFGCYDHEGGIS